MNEKKPKCSCGGTLQYEAELGAPGIGYSYKCKECGKGYYTRNKTVFWPWADVQPEDCVLDISDVY